MLSEIDIKHNKDYFCQIYNDTIMHREGGVALYEWLLNSSFFIDPASTKYHESYAGGLCEHTLKVYDALSDLVYLFNPDFTHMSIATVSLLHDICKVGVYKETYKNVKSYDEKDVLAAEKWKVKHDNLGDFVWVSEKTYLFEDSLPLGHGEKSLYLASKFLTLLDDEALAIRYHMGAWDLDDKRGLSNAFEKSPLTVLLHMADTQATYLTGDRT